MASIRISGMASGLPPDIVEQIMNAEKIPVKNLETKKSIQEETLKMVSDLETKVLDITKNLGELTGVRGFTDTKLISGDPSIVEGSVDPSASVTGEYSIEVQSLAQKPGALSNGFPDKDQTQIGVGYLRFQTPEGEREVYVGSGAASTLEGVVKQINAANLGVRAMVFEDHKNQEAPYRLMITGLSTGTEEQIEFPTVYLLDGDQDFYFDQSRKGQNAKVKVDGFEVELSENVVKDLIPGVTLDLKQAAPGREVRVSIKEDMEVISGKVKSFVDAYNGALSWIQGQNKLQKGQSGRESLGPLGGDSLIRNIESRLRRIIQTPQYGLQTPITRVIDIGIEFNRNGTLNFSEEKFNKALATNPAGVAMFLRGDGFNVGFVPTLKREIGSLTDGQFGALAQRKRGLQDKVDTLNRQIEGKERQLEKKEEQLRRKFSDLEGKMAKIQQQGASLGAGPGMPKG